MNSLQKAPRPVRIMKATMTLGISGGILAALVYAAVIALLGGAVMGAAGAWSTIMALLPVTLVMGGSAGVVAAGLLWAVGRRDAEGLPGRSQLVLIISVALWAGYALIWLRSRLAGNLADAPVFLLFLWIPACWGAGTLVAPVVRWLLRRGE